MSKKNTTVNQSRRRFLAFTAMGAGSVAVTSQYAFAAIPESLAKKTDPSRRFDSAKTSAGRNSGQPTHCITPRITTRLFASSNKAVDDTRHNLGLQRLACAGFKVQNPEVNDRQYLRFSGTDAQRASDLQNLATGAIEAPKLLLAARGGYGALRLLDKIDWRSLGQIMKEKGTILAGFSDVTAIQCALLSQGHMSSLAAPMLYSEFGKPHPDKVSCRGFVEALTTPNLMIEIPQPHLYSHHSVPSSRTIQGKLWGGNLSVVSALAGSAYLPRPEGGIVFLEDVGEQPYRIERMMYALYLAGAFTNQQAVVLGAFNNIGTDSYDNRYNLHQVLKHMQQKIGLPLYTGLPFGHIAKKQSVPLGATCRLTVTSQRVKLEFSDYPTIDSELINTAGLWT